MKLTPERVAATLRQALPPVVLLYGQEQGVVEQIAARLEGAALGDAGEDAEFDRERFMGSELAAEPFFAACRALPFLAQRRLVVVKEAERLTAEGRNILLEYLEAPSPSTLLVCTAGNLEARDPVRKAMEAHPQGWCIPCYPLEPPALRRWLREELAREGFQPTPDALEQLAILLEGDTRAAAQELEKLKLFMGEERQIRQEDVLALVGETATTSGFALAAAITAGDGPEALGILDRLLESGEEPLALLNLVARRLRQLAQGGEALAAGENPKAITGRLRIFWKEEGQFLAHCRRWRPPTLARGLLACLEADQGLKGGGLPPEQVMGNLVLQLVSLANR